MTSRPIHEQALDESRFRYLLKLAMKAMGGVRLDRRVLQRLLDEALEEVVEEHEPKMTVAQKADWFCMSKRGYQRLRQREKAVAEAKQTPQRPAPVSCKALEGRAKTRTVG